LLGLAHFCNSAVYAVSSRAQYLSDAHWREPAEHEQSNLFFLLLLAFSQSNRDKLISVSSLLAMSDPSTLSISLSLLSNRRQADADGVRRGAQVLSDLFRRKSDAIQCCDLIALAKTVGRN
jgi:hypothetical protein